LGRLAGKAGTELLAMTSEQERSEDTNNLISQEATNVLKNLSPPDSPKKNMRDPFWICFIPDKKLKKKAQI